jgi:predicted ATPase/class 3 adenylate cyclase
MRRASITKHSPSFLTSKSLKDNIGTETISVNVPGFGQFKAIASSEPYNTFEAVDIKNRRTVVLKTLTAKFPGKEDLAKLQREANLLKKLASEHVVEVLDVVQYGRGNLALVKEPFGIPLSDYLDTFPGRILPLDLFFEISIGIADMLGYIHELHVVHKDITPGNILIDPISKKVKITDFSSASELSREYKELNMSSRIEGTLAYISPEQTGRMNRDIDYRSDYYALGVTYYQMLTGTLPFLSEDPLEMVHFHIGKVAPLANSVNPDIPEILARLINKLMAKNAEERYQSVFGLKRDLNKCAEAFHTGHTDGLFDLGTKDISRRFTIPQRLYGREREMKELETHLANAAQGTVQFCLISGYSGVGKSVLVYELARSIARQKGFLISGKFDQYRQNSSYFAIAQAFKELIKQLLGEPEEKIEVWKENLLEALGQNGQLLIDFIPELEMIIGKQPQVQELSPEESQNRFLLLFTSFVKVFAKEEHPLVLLLDDLQWSDIASLNIINRLATSPALSHLMIVGTYRDNEVDARHPLMLRIREIEQKRAIQKIALEPLNIQAMQQLIRDTLSTDEEAAANLSEILFDKTHGNPFFTVQLLKNLYERKTIYFNSEKGSWDWNNEEVKKIQYSSNVIDILVSSQKKLDASSQTVLQLASCIGATFDLQTLSVIYEHSVPQTAFALLEPLKLNMVVSLDSAYQYIDLLEDEQKDVNPIYKFQHDRIQQAAYLTIPGEKRESLHLSIGWLMRNHSSKEELEERIIDIVSHLNAGKALLSKQEEKVEFANLSLAAGIKAKQSATYRSALDYLVSGHEILGANAWEDHHELTWMFAEQLQHCYYLTGNWDQADLWTESMLEHARTDLQKGQVLAARTRQYATIGKMKESIDAAYEGLKILGFNLIDRPTKDDIQREVELVKKNLEGRAIPSLIDVPQIADPKAKIASELFMEMFAAAFLSGSGEKFPYIVLNYVNLALVYGSGPESAFGFAAYGMLLCGFLNKPGLGNQFGRLAIDMIEKFDGVSLKSRIYYVYTMFVSHWSNHWSHMTPLFRKGIETGYQSGDLLYLAYSAQDCIIWDPTIDLETAYDEHRKLLEIVKECDYQDSYDSGTLFLQMQLNFLGKTKGQYSLEDDQFDEEECVKGMQSRHFMTGIANYNIYKAEIHLMYNDFQGALQFVEEQEKLKSSVMSLPQQARFCTVSFLVYSKAVSNVDHKRSDLFLERMKGNLELMKLWADVCEDNFLHLVYFMQAEMKTIEGEVLQALPLYEQAINTAHKYGWQRDEGMINEFAGMALLGIGLNKASEGYLYAAYYNYYQWGAVAKTRHLSRSYPEIFSDSPFEGSKRNLLRVDSDIKKSSSFNSELLDISSLFRASQIISGELILENLLRETLKILIENAGAQNGMIIEKTENELLMRSGIIEGEFIVGNKDMFPKTLLNVCFRTGDTIVIDDAKAPNEFSTDPYIKSNLPRSVMCVPLPKNGEMKAAVYFENNLTYSAFTRERIEVIKLLAGQASVSLENARIYNEQDKLLSAQQRFIPKQFLEHLGHHDISKVTLGESVATNMSVLFSDIRDFTPLVESLPPENVIQMLNSYYSTLGEPITQYGGFIDSFAGDQIMALFSDSPKNAVIAGIKMSEAVHRFNRESKESGMPLMRMGIGLNSGPLVLGTMGGRDRIQCTVLGDTVNLASRIEQLTKYYDSQFLIGEKTFKHVHSEQEFSLRMVDYVAVKGKDQAIKLYEVLNAESDERRLLKEKTKPILTAGLDAYYAKEFSNALKYFSEGAKSDPSDRIFELYKARSLEYIENHPGETWKGFEQMKHK